MDRIASSCASPLPFSAVILLTRPKMVSSMNPIRPSNIWALLAKCRYRAASDTSSFAASAAVVMRSAAGVSSICASVCRICSLRSPGLVAGIGGYRIRVRLDSMRGSCAMLAMLTST